MKSSKTFDLGLGSLSSPGFLQRGFLNEGKNIDRMAIKNFFEVFEIFKRTSNFSFKIWGQKVLFNKNQASLLEWKVSKNLLVIYKFWVRLVKLKIIDFSSPKTRKSTNICRGSWPNIISYSSTDFRSLK